MLLSFEDVLVTPYTALLDAWSGRRHVGGPIWPDWSRQHEARFCRRGQPVDERPEAVEPVAVVDDRDAFWIGPLTTHFGHAVADFSTRLAWTLEACPRALVVFARSPGPSSWMLRGYPRFLLEMLAWHGVEAERFLFVKEPTLFRRLSVVPQGEQLDHGPPCDRYLDRLAEISERNLGKVEKNIPFLYVSRAGRSARFAGERHLETVLEARPDVVVFRPEDHPLRAQLATYRAASTLVFAEGSAVHGLQLLGRGLGHVHIINRRPGKRIAEGNLLPRCASLTYHDCVAGVVHGLNPAGRPMLHHGMTVLDRSGLVAALNEIGIGGPAVDAWGPFDTAIDDDLKEWLRDAQGNGASDDAQCRAHILQTLRAVDRGGLMEAAGRGRGG